MSFFAVSVTTGKEVVVKELILKYLRNRRKENLIKAIHAFEKARYIENNNSVIKTSAFSVGYIFIETKESIDELWEYIKNASTYVKKIINKSIPKEEIERIYENLGLKLEDEVEVKVDIDAQVEEKKNTLFQLLNFVKTKRQKNKIKRLLNRLDANPNYALHRQIIKLLEQKKENAVANPLIKSLLANFKYFAKGKSLRYIIPYSLYQKITVPNRYHSRQFLQSLLHLLQIKEGKEILE